MFTRLIIAVTVWILSTAWLVPLMLSASFLWSWIEVDVSPTIYGREHHINSFPYLSQSQRFFWFGFWWLTIVVLAWAFVLVKSAIFGRIPHCTDKSSA